MRNHLTYLWITLVVLGCSRQPKETWYDTSEICDCISLQKAGSIDDKFNACADDFNKGLTNENPIFQSTSDKQEDIENDLKEFATNQLFTVLSELVNFCEAYRTEFDNMVVTRYERGNKEDFLAAYSIDTLQREIERGQDAAKKTCILAEMEIFNDNDSLAFVLVENALNLDSDLDYAYMIRAYLNHRRGDYNAAINDCQMILKISEDEDLLWFTRLWIGTLKKKSLPAAAEPSKAGQVL